LGIEQHVRSCSVPCVRGCRAAPPLLLMSHGIGAQKDMGLDMYAVRFVESGIATLVVDYRWAAQHLGLGLGFSWRGGTWA